MSPPTPGAAPMKKKDEASKRADAQAAKDLTRAAVGEGGGRREEGEKEKEKKWVRS